MYPIARLRWSLPTIALLLASCASAPTAARDETRLKSALQAQATAWDEAIVRKDADAIAANMAPGFLQIGSDGRTADHDQFLAAITGDQLEIDPYTVEDFKIRIYGDAAVLNGRTDMTGRYAGKPFRTHYRYTDVYVRDPTDGRWRVVQVQTTAVAE